MGIRRSLTGVVAVVLLLGFMPACGGRTYHAASVGYRIHTPGGWADATSHREERLEQTALGIPIDLAITDFTGQRDFFFGGGERYLVVGLRGPWEALPSVEVSDAFVRGLAGGLHGEGTVEVVHRAHLESATEVHLHVMHRNRLARAVYLRCYVASQAMYFLVSSVDLEHAGDDALRDRRAEWMKSFQVVPLTSTNESLWPMRLDELGRAAANLVIRRGLGRRADSAQGFLR